jgi:hypothetical protein
MIARRCPLPACPNIDRTSGGSLIGMLAAFDTLLAASGPATRIAPAKREAARRAGAGDVLNPYDCFLAVVGVDGQARPIVGSADVDVRGLTCVGPRYDPGTV